jgi:hypothetical protein
MDMAPNPRSISIARGNRSARSTQRNVTMSRAQRRMK